MHGWLPLRMVIMVIMSVSLQKQCLIICRHGYRESCEHEGSSNAFCDVA